MNNSFYYRKFIEDIIEKDKININIIRVTKEPDGYGGHTETEETISEGVRLYKSGAKRVVVNDMGVIIGHQGYSQEKILALPEADIREGDTFTVGNRQYKVKYVQQYFNICKQIDLEVVKIDN